MTPYNPQSSVFRPLDSRLQTPDSGLSGLSGPTGPSVLRNLRDLTDHCD